MGDGTEMRPNSAAFGAQTARGAAFARDTHISACLRSLAIPFGHLRDLIAFVGSHCLPVGYFILWDFGTRFVGRLWTLELVRLVPLNVLDC